ncbi:pyridoxamine 5'-phosphate oxidase family protein [Noviherbaspirillum sp.]|uniref:pyridoxamine 5'-phosphate oxidase family protein n=1 Tax=Noviherbaspirillum sp. TaxID=1926288 RepID=UPI002B4A5E06|nr:pyridoxamine 5'-phosphate oxidase family protein [Noviherbaspirillum sp.]HJV83350.1 pyridoxamine 5'-phosphate oxidase family protein [Noviherbaspirillum sp.]HJW55215.1 pyridoxamine 5'-phosphate oxidase family protein [Burkholderiaceae bacterium]
METDPLLSSEPGQPFHAGEIAAQERVGVRSQMEKVGRVALRDYMPQQHRDFFPLLPTFFVGGSDDDGRLWASLLWGEPGFMQSPDPVSLRIASSLQQDDPLAAAMRPGYALGGLGLQFETRRRNRVNGLVSDMGAQGFTLGVQQSFGNCAKYIQTRERLPLLEQRVTQRTAGVGILPDAARALIRQCDTFFIASAAGQAVDVSHRGGRPGFVQVDAQGGLMWPDFQGNNLFNTIGNLLADGRAGLLFIDFEQGDLLHLSGRADVVWEGPQVDGFAGAKRMLRFAPERFVFRQGALPMRWVLRESSPHLDATASFA